MSSVSHLEAHHKPKMHYYLHHWDTYDSISKPIRQKEIEIMIKKLRTGVAVDTSTLPYVVYRSVDGFTTEYTKTDTIRITYNDSVYALYENNGDVWAIKLHCTYGRPYMFDAEGIGSLKRAVELAEAFEIDAINALSDARDTKKRISKTVRKLTKKLNAETEKPQKWTLEALEHAYMGKCISVYDKADKMWYTGHIHRVELDEVEHNGEWVDGFYVAFQNEVGKLTAEVATRTVPLSILVEKFEFSCHSEQ